MNASISDLQVGPVKKRSIKTSRHDKSYRARETEGYFRTTTQSEAVLRFIAIVIVLGAFIQWLLPDGNGAEMMMTKVGLAVAFSIIGLALYTFAMRGSRYEIELNPTDKTLTLSRLDRRDNLRKAKRLHLDDIKSIYVLKGDGVGIPSKMRIRLRHHDEEITALRGHYDDVELMHRTLCRSIRMLNG
jgi:hypothetical protein